MRFLSRLPLSLLSVVFLAYLYLGVFAIPVFADNTGFLSLINSYRQQNGLGTLTEDQNLTNAACWFASDMASKNYFPSNHVDSQGRGMAQRLADFGVSSGSRAENIFYTTVGSSASVAFDAWKNSSGHNTNMLGSYYTRIGIGRVKGSGKWYWVTDFASGTTVTMTSQCGVSAAPPPPVAKKPPPPPPAVQPPPPASVVETPIAETPTLTTASATISAHLASRSATKSATVSKLILPKKPPITLVQGVAATSLILGNFALFAFILWRLYHHHFLR